MSRESRMKMSLAAKKRPKSSWAKSADYKLARSKYNKANGITVKNRPKVEVKDSFGNTYTSILEASIAMGVNYHTLWNQVRGRRTNRIGVKVK